MNEKTWLAVKTRSESTRVELSDVLVIERRARKIFVATTDRLISYYDQLRNIKPLLGDNFFEVYSGCLINLDRLDSAKEGILYFDNGYELPLSERSFVRAKQKHYAYYRVKQLRDVKEIKAAREVDEPEDY